jgi:PBP1b-binding outer membrane lipoprotein LpoB
MMKRLIVVCAVALLAVFGNGCSKAYEQKAERKVENKEPVKVGPVKMNPHPVGLEILSIVGDGLFSRRIRLFIS